MAAHFYLTNLKTEEDLKKIIIERWGYNPLPPVPLAFAIKEETKEKIVKAEAIAEYTGFQAVFFRLDDKRKTPRQTVDQFLRSAEREIISQIPKTERQTKLFVFSSKDGGWWHFVSAAQVGNKLQLKRFSIEPENRDRLRTASEQLDKIKIDPTKDTTLQKVKVKHEEAFSVEALTDRFFKEYIKVFEKLKGHLYRQKKDIDDAAKIAHHYTHQLLNRIMFLYFVQKRGCFNGDKNFLHTFWNAYRDNLEGKNEFHEKWLKVLFFEALNNKFSPKDYFKLPEQYPDLNKALQMAPFLNGGLFREDRELDSVGYKIEDTHFTDIFDFLEGYNFTIQESTPLDQDLSIDPEMLGNIYEMLVNVSEADDEKHKAGIFYTPKVEIELMLRRSLVEFLRNKTDIERKKLYEFVFKETKEQEIPEFSRDERDNLLKELDEMKLVDPACGSGHYLVVVAQILYELKEVLYQQKGISPNKFEEKRKIIENSIFGVDVKEWATEVAKLRLWLDLFVDANEEKFQILEPLLPSLSFKIRVGDSLVQEIGGIYFSPSAVHGLSPSLRGMLNQLKDLKKRFYNNDRFVSENQVKGQELGFYEAILDERIRNNQDEITKLEYPLKKFFQQKLIEIQKGKGDFEQMELSLRNKKRIESLERENDLLEEQKDKLNLKSKFAFWPIEFAEIFAEKDGFDIVIANPPYVRQEIIADPTKDESTLEERRGYKEKLQKQLQEDWDDSKGNLIDIPKRSDLYVYFYLKGLKLLNPDGVFCYISSNSWLDVGYGAALQEILLRRVPILAVYDNQAKRSFKHADVNTIIVILGAPNKKDWKKNLQDNMVKFVMFKKPFEEIMFTENFLKIEEAHEREDTDLLKVFPVSQIELWKAGAEPPKDQMDLEPELWEYQGNKWGGKYLRAPEIYWKILEKAGNRLVKLKSLGSVKYGLKTGATKYFFVNEEVVRDYGIEKEYLLPVFTTIKETDTILVNKDKLNLKLFCCNKTKGDLDRLGHIGTLNYIRLGEESNIHKVTNLKGKSIWYSQGEQMKPDMIVNQFIGDRFLFVKGGDFIATSVFFVVKFDSGDSEVNVALTNSTFTCFSAEILGRKTYGIGVMYIYGPEIENLLMVNPHLLRKKEEKIRDVFKTMGTRPIRSIFNELGIDPSRPIRSQEPKPLPDRKALDDIIFDALDLTKEERKEVYWTVCELVKNRLEKAKSL